ncbi:MAG: hypothetical protein DHS20C17_14360 [Cyclobacteriaceae bacterium]|nr:MAG: hypothetical protein DHS20C17_14360 [Cyclobacteriaceae bacterium]
MDAIKEFCCQFGELGRLNGIVTIPANESKPDVAVILVTAGFTPKAGPFRLYTLVARESAKKGLVCLRFDLGGIGNSEQLDTGKPLSVRTKLDIDHAVKFLKNEYGIKKYVLGGLCSGAEDSFIYARHDPDVVGVFLIDGHAYITRGYRLRLIFSRKLVKKMGRVILSKLRLLPLIKHSNESSLEGDQSGLVDYKQLDIEDSTVILKSLLSREVKLLYIYTAGMSDKFNGAKQFNEMFPKIDSKNLITLKYLPRMGHVQIFEEDRKEICGAISNWLEGNFVYSG